MSEEGRLLPGQRLRAEREARDISQEDAANRLNLTVTFLQALEADEYERLPEATFVRGYIRNYARELDLPADELVSVFSEIMQEQESVPETVEVMPSRRRRWIPMVSVALVLAVVLVVLLWPQDDTADPDGAAPATAAEETESGSADQEPESQSSESDDEASDAEASGPDESGANEAESEPELEPARLAEGQNEEQAESAEAADRLAMTFSGDCWLEVRDASGQVVFEGRRSAGVALNVSGEAPFELRIGDASAVESLSINDEQQTMPSRAAGQVVRLSVP
jgi:cytoskeleton protein RodZ